MNRGESSRRKPVVLLVDDQPRNLQLLGNALFKNGYDVALASSGAEALESIRESPPDLVLLDVMMPGMDGFEVCRRLKESEVAPDLEVIFVTAKSQKEDLLEGFEAGGVDYITKPIQLPEVLARVRSQVSLKFARDDLRAANAELSHVIETQQRFLSILAHDVRAPLAGLDNLLADCVENAPNLTREDLVEMAHACRDSSSRLVNFFEDALVWARTEVGGSGETPEPLSVSDAVESTRSLLRSLLEKKGIRLESEIPPGAAVETLPNAFSTVLRNLVSNAIKFSRPGSRVWLRATEEEGRWRLSVEDEGVGMSEERVRSLFDPARRQSTLGTGKEKGAGVGLILCRSLVERMGGELSVESEEGKGSRFSFAVTRYA